MRRASLLICLFLFAAVASAQLGPVQNHCFQGGTKATVSNLPSSNYLQGIIPACTVSVYLHGTTTLAPIYADSIGTVLPNPFTANVAGPVSVNPGGWIFWASTGVYDVTMSGGNSNASCTTAPLCYTQPVTYTVQIGGGGGGGGGVTNVSCGNLPPLFGCTVNTPTTTPNVQFTQQNAAANTIFGNFSGTSGPPFFAIFTCTGLLTCTYNSGTNVWNVNIPTASALSVAATAPIQVNGGTGPISSGVATISCPSCGVAQLQTQIVPPVAGQYIVLKPNTCSDPGTPSPTANNEQCYADNASGFVSIGPLAGILVPPLTSSLNFSGWTLSGSGVTPGQVTNIYVGVNYNSQVYDAVGQISCTGGSTGSFANTVVPVTQFIHLTGLAASAIPTVVCTPTTNRSSGGTNYSNYVNLNSIFLLVYYTGTPVPLSNALNIAPPLTYANNTLGVDANFPWQLHGLPPSYLPGAGSTPPLVQAVLSTGPTDCSGSGTYLNLCVNVSGSWVPWTSLANNISGQTVGYLLKATSATASTTSSLAQDTGTTAGSGNFIYHGAGFVIPETTPAAGIAANDVLTADSTTHRWLQNPNNIGPLVVPGTSTTPATAGNCVQYAANGYDLIPTGSSCGGGAGGLPTATAAGQLVASVSAGTSYNVEPSDVYWNTGDTITSINSNTLCSVSCVYHLTGTVNVTSSATLAAGISVIASGGGNFNVSASQTLTLSAPFTAPDLVQHFKGSGTTKISALQGDIFPQWWGAVADGAISGTGTDNTAAINNTIASVPTNGFTGSLVFPGGIYKTTATINAGGKNNFNIRGNGQGYYYSAGGPTTTQSQIVSTSPTATIIDMSGGSGNGYWNSLKNISFQRSLVPTGGASIGVNVHTTCGFQMDGVESQDSFHDFDISGSYACGVGYFRNLEAGWGYNGFTETSGTYYGYYMVGPFNSTRMDRITSANNVGSAITTNGFNINNGGPQAINDLMVNGFEGALLTNAIVVAPGGSSSALQAADVHFTNYIIDGTFNIPIQVSSCFGSANCSVEFAGGWINGNNVSGTGNYGFDCENSTGVTLSHTQFVNAGNTAAIYLHNCTGNSVTGNFITNLSAGDGIQVNGGNNNSISANTITMSGVGAAIHLVSASKNSGAANSVNGGSATGLLFDATSNNNNFLVNSWGGSTTEVSDSGTGNAWSSSTKTQMQAIIDIGAKASSGTACLQIDTSGNVSNTGSPCGAGGGGSSWSSLTNPSTNLALTMAANTTTFTFNAATGANDLFKWTDTASNTGTGILGHFTTASGSTETPWQADANGIGWQVTNAGVLKGVGASTSHGVTIPEGTPLSGVASNDVITADSTTHQVLKNPNNTGNQVMVGTSTTAATSGHCVQYAANGYDISDAGAACGAGGGGGTAVNINGGSTITTLAMNGVIPIKCADSSGSGTAQSCSSSPSFTLASPNCFIYTTTTANSGTGLTIAVNGGSATNVAVASSTGWSTTLTTSPHSIPSGEPMLACYDGTNINMSATGIGGAAASNAAAQYSKSEFATVTSGSVSSATSPTFGITSGDLVVAIARSNTSGRTCTFSSTVSGSWTSLGSVGSAGGNIVLGYMTATGSSASATVTCTLNSADTFVGINGMDFTGGTFTFVNSASSTSSLSLTGTTYSTSGRTINVQCGTLGTTSANFIAEQLGYAPAYLASQNGGVGNTAATFGCQASNDPQAETNVYGYFNVSAGTNPVSVMASWSY